MDPPSLIPLCLTTPVTVSPWTNDSFFFSMGTICFDWYLCLKILRYFHVLVFYGGMVDRTIFVWRCVDLFYRLVLQRLVAWPLNYECCLLFTNIVLSS